MCADARCQRNPEPMARSCVLCTALALSIAAAFQRVVARPLHTSSRRAVRPPAAVKDEDDAPRNLDYYIGMAKTPMSADDSKRDMMTPTLKLAGGASALLVALLAAFFLANADVPPANALDVAVDVASDAAGAARTFELRGVTAQDTTVFAIGCFPFAWATWSFWTRIANGQSFGTGSDSIVFDTNDADEDQLRRFGGQRVLGKGALAIAYVLFAAAGGSVLLALVAALQVQV